MPWEEVREGRKVAGVTVLRCPNVLRSRADAPPGRVCQIRRPSRRLPGLAYGSLRVEPPLPVFRPPGIGENVVGRTALTAQFEAACVNQPSQDNSRLIAA